MGIHLLQLLQRQGINRFITSQLDLSNQHRRCSLPNEMEVDMTKGK